MRVSAGSVALIDDTSCVPVGDARAIVIRIGDEIRAFRNHCVRHGASLADAVVSDGIITCPVDDWCYRVTDGQHVDSSMKLERLPVEIVDGEAFVMMPATDPAERPRRLLADDRDDTWPNGLQRPGSG